MPTETRNYGGVKVYCILWAQKYIVYCKYIEFVTRPNYRYSNEGYHFVM